MRCWIVDQGFREADIREISRLYKEGQMVPIRKLFLIAERALQEAKNRDKSVVECFFKCLSAHVG